MSLDSPKLPFRNGQAVYVEALFAGLSPDGKRANVIISGGSLIVPADLLRSTEQPFGAAYYREALLEAGRQLSLILDNHPAFDYDVPPGGDAGTLRDKLRGIQHHIAGAITGEPERTEQANADAYTLEEAQRNVVRRLLMDAYRHPQVTNIEEAYAIVDGVTAHLAKQIGDFHAAVNADIARRHAEA